MERNFLKSSLQSASLSIIMQVLFRCITFILNAFVVHRVSQEAIGIMYVRLLLLESTILFLSREAFRKACLSKTMDHKWPQVINLVWLTVPLCTILCIVFGYIWLNILVQPDEVLIEHYRLGVWAIAISCIISMCCEPVYLIAQSFLFVKFRVIVDLISLLIRSSTFAFIIWYNPENALVAFSVAQMLYIMSYSLIFYGYFIYYVNNKLNISNKQEKKNTKSEEELCKTQPDFPLNSLRDFFPMKLQTEEQIDWKLLSMVWSFLKQGIMMQLLTEGERYVMTLLNGLTFAEQGVFDIVNNLGSLAARFIFRPIEESAYFYFSQLINRDQPIISQNKTSMDEAAFVLEHLLRAVMSLGMLVFCFGQAYSTLLLFLYGGVKLATGLGPRLLRTHCFAILLLAINGTTEAYALSTMNREQLNRYNKVMVGLSVGFLVANWLFLYLFGSVGFILANCCNMLMRITHNMRFISRRYKDTSYDPLNGLIPNKRFLVTLVLSLSVTCASERYVYGSSPLIHFLIGSITFLCTILIWLYEERQLIKFGIRLWKGKQS